MKNKVNKAKDEIRKETIGRLKDQDPVRREERSNKILEKLLSCDEYISAETVMTYVSMPEEVDTIRFIQKALKQGKRITVPYIETGSKEILASELTVIESLEKGPFGIYQPKAEHLKTISVKDVDLIVVPAIAYDENNMRLGRGGGYYDRFLSLAKKNECKTIGIAFNFQIFKVVPTDSHDQSVNKVITD